MRHLRPEAVLRLGCVRGSQGESRLQNVDGCERPRCYDERRPSLLSSRYGAASPPRLPRFSIPCLYLCVSTVLGSLLVKGCCCCCCCWWSHPRSMTGVRRVCSRGSISQIKWSARLSLSARVSGRFYSFKSWFVRQQRVASAPTRASSDTMTQYLLLSEPPCMKKKEKKTHSGGMMMVLLPSVAINRFT